MRGATSPLPNTPSWRAAQLKNVQVEFYLYLHPLVTVHETFQIRISLVSDESTSQSSIELCEAEFGVRDLSA
jgi:hypothetical protein